MPQNKYASFTDFRFSNNKFQFFQAIGKPLQSNLLGLSRQVLCYIPLLVLLPKVWGLNGVFYAMPVADGLSSIITLCFITIELKHLGKTIEQATQR